MFSFITSDRSDRSGAGLAKYQKIIGKVAKQSSMYANEYFWEEILELPIG
jgi:hypothetical protein